MVQKEGLAAEESISLVTIAANRSAIPISPAGTEMRRLRLTATNSTFTAVLGAPGLISHQLTSSRKYTGKDKKRKGRMNILLKFR